MTAFKKTASLLLVLILFLSLSSCGAKKAENAVSTMLDTFKTGEILKVADYIYLNDLMDDKESLEGKMLQSVLKTIDYKIVSSEKLDDITATVETYISIADLESFLPAILGVAAQHAEENPEITDEELSKYLLDLFNESIESKSFERVSKTIDISVITLEDGRLLPQAGDALIDAVFGNFTATLGK